MDNIIYTINRSSIKDVFSHLQKVSEQFSPSLDSRVNLDSYAEKIGKKAFRFEAWSNDWLIGLVACYVDEKKMIAYITNVSVEQDYQHIGIASKLLYLCLEMTGQKSVRQIKLQVYQSNDKAISLYKKMGFVVCGGDNDLYEMQLNKEKSEIVVSVCCLVYNHAPYLRECFEGFVMQKTNFPIEILVHDDASTDGSQEIIKEYTAKYPTLFKPIYQKENQYSKGIGISATYQFPRAKGRYIALCEGDDYWIDPYKLQKQVDFLELHTEYRICCHNAYIINHYSDNVKIYPFNVFLEKKTYVMEDIILNNWFVPTASIMLTKEVVKEYQLFAAEHKVFNGDYSLQIIALNDNYKLYYSNDMMSVYRLHKGGVSMIDLKKMNEYTIETLMMINKYTKNRYRDCIDTKIQKLNGLYELERFREFERKNEKKWHYRLRYFLLRVVRKILCLKNPNVVLLKKY